MNDWTPLYSDLIAFVRSLGPDAVIWRGVSYIYCKRDFGLGDKNPNFASMQVTAKRILFDVMIELPLQPGFVEAKSGKKAIRRIIINNAADLKAAETLIRQCYDATVAE